MQIEALKMGTRPGVLALAQQLRGNAAPDFPAAWA